MSVWKKMYDILMILVVFEEIFHDIGWFFVIRIRNTDKKPCEARQRKIDARIIIYNYFAGKL